MSSEIDHPRQRTVAELLAEHGTNGAAPRRRRRREDDAPEPDVPAPEPLSGADLPAPQADPVVARSGVVRPDRRAVPDRPVPSARRPDPPVVAEGSDFADGLPVADRLDRPALPDRSVLREPVPPQLPDAPSDAWPDAPLSGRRSTADRERPTDVLPRFGEQDASPDDGLTRPIPHQLAGPGVATRADGPAVEEGGPSTVVGSAPAGARAWHKARTDGARGAATTSEGSAAPAPDIAPDAADGPTRRPSRSAAAAVDAEDTSSDGATRTAPPRERRLGRRGAAEPSTGQAWAAVAAQWIAGAVGGAVLWVAFRFLWKDLPVVALAAAVLVTVGLVVVVRALLRNNDNRTTVFAVLVGLLLTVSPAILVMLGR